MARGPAYQGIVISGNMPAGFRGYARLTADKKYYFTGKRLHATTRV